MPADFGPPPPSTPYEQGTWLWDGQNPAQQDQQWYPDRAEFGNDREYQEYVVGLEHHRQTYPLEQGALAAIRDYELSGTGQEGLLTPRDRPSFQPSTRVLREPNPTRRKPKTERVKLTGEEIQVLRQESRLRRRAKFEEEWHKNKFTYPAGTTYILSDTEPNGIEIVPPPKAVMPRATPSRTAHDGLSLARRISKLWESFTPKN